MPIIQDKEFGKVTIRRSAKSTQIRIRVAPDGTLRASIPMYAPIFLVKNLLKNSKDELQKILQKSKPKYNFINGMQIGKSHTLIIQVIENQNYSVTRHAQQIIVKISDMSQLNNPSVDQDIRTTILAALKIEAKSYLPKRLSFLAKELNLTYEKARFSHSSGRWGSCSSTGTISLNIALMKLPFELIDYVIVHELSHTVEMNHGDRFWALVAKADPNYRSHRHALKSESPTI